MRMKCENNRLDGESQANVKLDVKMLASSVMTVMMTVMMVFLVTVEVV